VKDKYPYIETLVNSDDSGQVESGVNDRFYEGSFSLVDLYCVCVCVCLGGGGGGDNRSKEMGERKLQRKVATGFFQIQGAAA
jgi:hypothetical protein